MFNSIMIRRLLPPMYRGTIFISWLKALVTIPKSHFYSFKFWSLKQNRYRRYSSQTLSLQTFLRIEFSDNTIEIINRELDDKYIYWQNENQSPMYIYWQNENQSPTYIYWREELNNAPKYDFIVRIPIALQSFENEIHFCVNRLKLASKRYVIIYF
jgi:hypothetical protein